ncbi:MAG: VWA domain-containing protein [Vulcanimicrobiota bacterium]
MRLADPYYLLLLPLLLALLYHQVRQSKRRKPAVGYSDLGLVDWSSAARPVWEGHIPLALGALGMALLIVGLARPQAGLGTQNITSEGIDIMLCIDTSSSMEAQDLVPNRLAAAKEVSKSFVNSRPDDRIGVVVYAGVAYTQCPLTADHSTVGLLLDSIAPGITGVDGTAIGTALATCVNRLKDVPGKSKVIILLTDGRNNAGEIDPISAAQLANQFGLRIYTIGVGTTGVAPYTVTGPLGIQTSQSVRVDIDDETLTRIAQATGGKYFRATDNRSLTNVYREIDQLEKTETPREKVTRYRELFVYLVGPGGLLLAGAMLLAYTRYREVP